MSADDEDPQVVFLGVPDDYEEQFLAKLSLEIHATDCIVAERHCHLCVLTAAAYHGEKEEHISDEGLPIHTTININHINIIYNNIRGWSGREAQICLDYIYGSKIDLSCPGLDLIELTNCARNLILTELCFEIKMYEAGKKAGEEAEIGLLATEGLLHNLTVMMDNRELTDMELTFEEEDTIISCHKCVLFAACPIFIDHKLVDSQLMNEQSGKVLGTVTSFGAMVAVQYMYGNSVSVPLAMEEEVFHAAQVFDFQELIVAFEETPDYQICMA